MTERDHARRKGRHLGDVHHECVSGGKYSILGDREASEKILVQGPMPDTRIYYSQVPCLPAIRPGTLHLAGRVLLSHIWVENGRDGKTARPEGFAP